jgi:hypothetical protein
VSGKIRVEIIEDTIAVLVADDFESLTESIQVREAAKSLIDLINGLLFLHDGARSALQVGSSVYESGDGKWKCHSFIEPETLVMRTKVHSPTILLNGIPAPVTPPPELKWLQDAISDDVVADVLTYLCAQPDWFELYKAFERMRDDINRRLGDQHKQEMMGWPSSTNLNDFTESATVYRHSPPKWGRLNPTTAMKLEDARSLIRHLAQIWLDW